MKTRQTIARCVTIVMLCTATNLTIAQVIDLQNNAGNKYGRLNPVPAFNATALGIGTFTVPNQPASALHVNTNGLGNPFYGAGEVFRTQAPTANTQAWRMLSGTGVGTEKFRITNVGSSNDVFMGTVSAGNLNIITNTNNTARFSVNSGLPSIIQGSVPGDGLTIRSLGGNPLHNLDMWVDRPSPPTINAHIRWGQFGLIEGGSNRLQITGYIEGTEIIASISNKTNVL